MSYNRRHFIFTVDHVTSHCLIIEGIKESSASTHAKGVSAARQPPQTSAGHVFEKFCLPEAPDATELQSLWKIWVSTTLR